MEVWDKRLIISMEEVGRTMSVWKRKWRGLVITVAAVLFVGSAIHPAVSRAAENDQNGSATTEMGKSEQTEPNKNTNTSADSAGNQSIEPSGNTGTTGNGSGADTVTSTPNANETSGNQNPDGTTPGVGGGTNNNAQGGDGNSADSPVNSGNSSNNQPADDNSGGNTGEGENTGGPSGDNSDNNTGDSGTTGGDNTETPDAGGDQGGNEGSGDQGEGRDGTGGGNTEDSGSTSGGKVTVDDGQTYSSIEEALEKAREKATIQLTGDITTKISSTNSADAVITRSQDVTLDLNGHTWTFNATSSSRNASGTPDLIHIKQGTLTIKGDGAIVYNGSGNYAGACLFAEDGKVVIESGTFSSNVSAPLYIGGAAAEIKGGTFRNTAGGNAITMHHGSLTMSGGEIEQGSLTVEQKDGTDVDLTGGTFAKIKMTDGAVKDVLGAQYGFRKSSNNNKGDWITSLNQLEGSEITNVQVDQKPFVSLTLTATSGGNSVSSGETVEFSYAGERKYDLTASVNGTAPSSFQWAYSYNGGERKTLADAQGTTYSFSNNSPAGTYTYYAGATVDDYTEWEEFSITITPITGGKIENKSFPTQYTYGDSIETPTDGNTYFNLVNGPSADVPLTWTYTWYKDSVADANKVTPTNAGSYILRVEASDGPNYTASGDIPVTISPRPVTPKVEGTTTKVYDGTAEVKDAKIVLDGILSGDSSRVTATASSFAYNSANASAANQIIASDIKLTGERASNYTLSDTRASIAGTITKAKLLLKISVEPSTQKVNRPVDVSVTASYSDSTPMDNDGLKAENILLTVSGRNDTEESHSLAMQAAPGQYGVYRTSYTTAIKGDKTFEAVIVGNDNYEVSNAASDNSLTVMDKTGTTMTVTANKTEGITYGDSVKYTATVARANEDDADAFAGNVQFYIDSVESGNRVGALQPVTTSGEQVSVTADYKKLTAGEHKILAVFTANSSFEDATAEVATTVAKKPLTWDVSELTASKTEGTAGEVTVYGEIKLEGLLEEGDVTVKQPEVIKTNGLKSAKAGSFKVEVAPEEGEWEFDPADPKNYTLPEEEPQITAKVNALKELPNPPEAVDGKSFKLVMEEGISNVPDGLKNTSFNTPSKIEQELKRVLTESGVYKEENVAVYDVTLQVSTDEGATWQEADYTNFPEGGLKVTLPYPSGTGRYTNNFAAAHMFATSYFGKTSGNVELPAIRKTDNGMEFTVTGLSPIALAWSAPGEGRVNASGGVGAGSGGTATRILGALTGDQSPILLYGGLAGATALVLVTVMITSKRRRRAKRR